MDGDPALAGFLGATRAEPGAMSFRFGRELHGAFGGVFGGVIAAGMLLAARDLAGGRLPSGLDIRFLRALPGDATAEAAVLHAGRMVTVTSVDLRGADGRHVARATVSFVDPHALEPMDGDDPTGQRPLGELDYASAAPWQPLPGRDIPIVTTLAPRIVGRAAGGIATALVLPWTPDAATAAEACCFAADLCVGPPVAAACAGAWVPHPNPDLSLRFTGAGDVTREVAGIGTVERLAGGLAAVGVRVASGGRVVAVGAATSLLLATARHTSHA